MKKIIFILVCAFGMIAATKVNAQTYKGATTINATTAALGTKLVDTTDNTETNYIYFPVANVNYCTFQCNVTKLSGTLNGCLTLEWSNDGVNYKAASAADTAHVSNTTGLDVYWFVRTQAQAVPYKFCRVKSVGRGTASYKFDVWIDPER
jgi:hypothetical protein